jgi:UDP-N-acetylmuramyl pentapeptide phosphotransferase/UDP-N-acetylglucosamine-1-phosphate transferase
MRRITGFLFFNFNPAKVFMGDCGSMFLGFTIASTSILCFLKSSAFVGLALPVAALGIPVFDTLFSMLRRFLERRSIFSADRSHFHHNQTPATFGYCFVKRQISVGNDPIIFSVVHRLSGLYDSVLSLHSPYLARFKQLLKFSTFIII